MGQVVILAKICSERLEQFRMLEVTDSKHKTWDVSEIFHQEGKPAFK